MELKRDSVYTVKIYFIEPVDMISVVIDALIKMEFETYHLGVTDRDKLLTILVKDMRNVVFVCITNDKEVEKTIQYIDELKKIENSHILVGAFVYNNLQLKAKTELLERNTAVIQFSDIQNDTLGVLKKILIYFEATGTRKNIRVATTGQSEAYFSVKNLEKPLKANVLNISSQAFLCKIDEPDRVYFSPGEYFHDVLLNLKGIRIRTSAKVLGYNKDAPEIYILKFCTAKMINNKLNYLDTIPIEIKNKLHNYIKICLRDTLARELSEIK